jgi:hypothetical protein
MDPTTGPAVPLGGGVGDTSFECVTGNGAEVGVPEQVTACGWATGRTLALLMRDGPDPDPGAKTLSALMLKMWPDLVRD